MNRTEYLLACVAEECAEIAQRATKAQRFGMFEVQPGQHLNNAARVALEFADLIGVVEMLEDHAGLSIIPVVRDRIDAKQAKVREFMAYSVECGTLDAGEEVAS